MSETRDAVAALIAQHRPHFGYGCTCGWQYQGPVDPRGSMDEVWAGRSVHLAEVLDEAELMQDDPDGEPMEWHEVGFVDGDLPTGSVFIAPTGATP